MALVASISLFGQEENIEILWKIDGDRLYFPEAYFEDNELKVPYFIKLYEWNFNDAEPIVQITTRVTEPVSKNFSLYSQINSISFDPEVEYSIVTERNKQYVQIKILPFIRKENGGIERVENFDIALTPSNKKSARSTSSNPDWKSNSILSSGSWYKIAVEEDGIHKLTFSQLKEIGMSTPENIRLYGFGAKLLPESFSKGHIDDLNPIPIHMYMGDDNTFGPGDFILFYAEGPVGWEYERKDKIFIHKQHDYSWRGYYFLTDNHGTSIPAQKQELSSKSPTHDITSFDFRDFLEEERYNLINSGKEWYGDNFNVTLEKNYPFIIPNRVLDEGVKIMVNTAARSNIISSFSLKVDNKAVGSISAQGANLNSYVSTYAYEATGIFNAYPQKENLTISLKYEKPNSNSEGWLDYIIINGRSHLRMIGNQLQFRDSRSIGNGNIGEFNIEGNTENLIIWEITDPGNPKQIEYSQFGLKARFNIPIDNLREFIAFYQDADFKSPLYNEEELGPVANQDLHGLQHPDMVIITPQLFLEQARRLADHRRSNDGIESVVVLQEEVFNEFSSGTPDVVAIRNFMKMFYDRSINSNDYCKYLLLFGDGSYDNRNHTEQNTNLILTYQSNNSLSPTQSYVSDDFFGLLDTDENLYNGLLDIGIGRLPVSTIKEAEIVVNKIISYDESSTKGTWRNEICFIGDDEDANLHMRQADQLASKVEELHPGFKINKIYLDAYKQERSATGYRYPDVNRAINDQINRGALIVNYTGHGGPTGLAHEQILTMNDIFSWTNAGTLPVIMTATCEFSRYDEYDHKQDVEITSAGEEVLLSPEGGSAGLFTTTRLVYAGPNFVLNEKFYDIVFSKDDNQQKYRLGDIIAYSKNNAGGGINKRNFSLLGDPSMSLAQPEYKVITDSINGVSVFASSDTLSAFERVTVAGHIETYGGQTIEQFKGKVFPIVYDKATIIKTLANDQGKPLDFQARNNILYKGETAVEDGKFSFQFFVPKDINYSIGEGKIIYYSNNDKVDAHGSFKGFKVGGIGTENAIDNEAPIIEVFMNDSFFISGGITDHSPELLVFMSDNFGINAIGNGIGHDLIATLDGDRVNSVVLNELYKSNFGSYNSGIIRYPYFELEEGRHEITVKIWDIHNNSSESSIEFVVTGSEEMLLENLFNYPNPFKDRTWFNIEHNRPDVPLEVKLTIYNMSGQIVRIISRDINSAGFRLDPIEWDGSSSSGSPLDGGLYLYKIELTTANGETVFSNGKMIISR